MNKISSFSSVQGTFSHTAAGVAITGWELSPRELRPGRGFGWGECDREEKKGGGQLAKRVATSILLPKIEAGSPGHPHWLLEYDLVT